MADRNIVQYVDLNIFLALYLHHLSLFLLLSFKQKIKHFKKICLKKMAMFALCCFTKSFLFLFILKQQVKKWNKICAHKLKYNWQTEFTGFLPALDTTLTKATDSSVSSVPTKGRVPLKRAGTHGRTGWQVLRGLRVWGIGKTLTALSKGLGGRSWWESPRPKEARRWTSTWRLCIYRTTTQVYRSISTEWNGKVEWYLFLD